MKEVDDIVFDWDDAKNLRLKQERNVCFEEVVLGIENGRLLEIVKNPSRGRERQYCLIVEIGGYAYVVPFVRTENVFFLKTIYPSRKQTRKYLGGRT